MFWWYGIAFIDFIKELIPWNIFVLMWPFIIEIIRKILFLVVIEYD